MNDERRPDESITAFTMRKIRLEIIEECAKSIEEIPSGISLYENAKVANAVTGFKLYAVSKLRDMT